MKERENWYSTSDHPATLTSTFGDLWAGTESTNIARDPVYYQSTVRERHNEASVVRFDSCCGGIDWVSSDHAVYSENSVMCCMPNSDQPQLGTD